MLTRIRHIKYIFSHSELIVMIHFISRSLYKLDIHDSVVQYREWGVTHYKVVGIVGEDE